MEKDHNGFVPSMWESKRVDQFIDLRRGTHIPVDEFIESGEYPVYGANGIMGQYDDWLVEPNTIIIGGVGAYCGNIKLTDSKSWVTSNAIIAKIDETRANPYYVANALQEVNIKRFASQTAQPSISQSVIKTLRLPIPPLPEQRRIAEILSTVDEQIKQTDDIVEATKDLKRGLMQSLLSGSDSKDTREVRFGSNLGIIPAEWEVTRLSQVCEKIVDGPHSTPDYTDTGVPFVSVGDIENGEIDFENCKRISEEDDRELRPRVDPQVGDILLGKVGSLGRVCIVDNSRRFNIFVQLALLRPINEKILPGYLGTALQYRQMQQQVLDNASGAAMQYIGTGAIGNLEIPLPPIEEQKEISKGFEHIRQKLRLERRHRSRLQELKRGLMQDLLTGKVRVNPDN